MLKIIILDEKKRKGVLNMAAAVYALSTIIRYTLTFKTFQIFQIIQIDHA
jgi:hypothetical protein